MGIAFNFKCMYLLRRWKMSVIFSCFSYKTHSPCPFCLSKFDPLATPAMLVTKKTNLLSNPRFWLERTSLLVGRSGIATNFGRRMLKEKNRGIFKINGSLRRKWFHLTKIWTENERSRFSEGHVSSICEFSRYQTFPRCHWMCAHPFMAFASKTMIHSKMIVEYLVAMLDLCSITDILDISKINNPFYSKAIIQSGQIFYTEWKKCR